MLLGQGLLCCENTFFFAELLTDWLWCVEQSRADHHAEVSRLETKIVKLENDAESKDTEIASLQVF